MSKYGDSSSSELTSLTVSILRECVVSVASFTEGTMFFGCTGLFIPTESGTDATSVLTSASLVRSFDDENKIIDNLKIKVRLPDDLVVIGWLHHYDLKYDLAVVNIERLHVFCASKISSRHQVQFDESTKVVAVQRCFDSGLLTTTCGIEIGRLNDEFCELDMALIGGPLFGFGGSFAGIICRGGARAVFVPRDKIIECLEHFGFRTDNNQGGCGTKTPITIAIHKFPRRSDYPIPKKLIVTGELSVTCVYNSFEDKFEGDIWSTLSKELSSTLSECVVALASFNEGSRHFACTGVFIDCYPGRILTSASLVRSTDDKSKIYDNLRDFCFKNCKLMATKGELVDKPSKLDCKELGTSTCKITKVGIGGPLIDICGNFVGMNFIDDKETLYLPREKNSGTIEAL